MAIPQDRASIGASSPSRPPVDLLVLIVGSLALLAASLALPLYQLLKGHGYLYYENHYDESAYLQYGFSKAMQSLARPSQYLVTLAHEAGLSAGYINAIADIGMFLGFPLLVRALLRRVGFAGAQASLGALFVMVLPQLVLTSNPLVRWLHEWTIRSGMIFWITTPTDAYSPFARTPEPQFSLMLLGAAMLVALRWRRFWPVYGVLPFLYPFVAIPAAFVALACHLHRRWPAHHAATAGPLLLAFVGVGAACWGYYTYLVNPLYKTLVLASHLPLLSFTSAVGVGAYLALRRAIAPEHRFFALALALASLAGANQHVISGHVPQPFHFDYYVGTVAVAGVAVLGLRNRRGWLAAGLVVGGVMFFQTAYHTFRVYQGYTIRLPLTEALVTALKEDSAHVVVNDINNANVLSMVHPRQPFTALAHDRVYLAGRDRYVEEYRCVKRQILADYGPQAFKPVLKTLDHAYLYGEQDFVLSNLNRTTDFKPLHDVSPAACRDPHPLRLHYFFINWFPAPKRLTPSRE